MNVYIKKAPLLFRSTTKQKTKKSDQQKQPNIQIEIMDRSDRYDSHSISQESTSEHPNQGASLDELNDEQIQAQIDEVL